LVGDDVEDSPCAVGGVSGHAQRQRRKRGGRSKRDEMRRTCRLRRFRL
jgi:hypothetical protein